MFFGGSRFYARQGGLVGDLRDAVRPVIWHMGLAQGEPVTFSVEQNGGLWELGTRDSKGTFSPIAEYENKAAAQKALRRLACGLKRQGWGRRVGVLSVFVVLGLLGFLVWSIGQQLVSSLGPTPPPTGQSLSADDVLQAPR